MDHRHGHRDDIDVVMPSLDVLVTLSGGSVMVEAIASGVPVITATTLPPHTLGLVRDGESAASSPHGIPMRSWGPW